MSSKATPASAKRHFEGFVVHLVPVPPAYVPK